MELYGCAKNLLANESFIYTFLDEMPDHIEMTKISLPNVMKYLEPPHEKWGISGFVIIAESHISVHTYPEQYFAALDIFSCKEFDEQSALEKIISYFKPAKYDHKMFQRGFHYPVDVKKTKKIIFEQRRNLALL